MLPRALLGESNLASKRIDDIGFLDELGHGKLARAVDANEQEELSFSSLHFGDVYVEEADRVAFELRPPGLVALDVRQA